MKPDLRKLILTVIKAAFVKPLVLIYGAMLIYAFINCLIMYQFGLWDLSQLKITIIWLFSFALISVIRANEIHKEPVFLKKAILDNINLLIFLEFVLGFYLFPLVIELILVPICTLLVSLRAFANRKEHGDLIIKLLDSLLAGFGLIVLSFAIYKLIIGFNEFASIQTFRDFYTPPLLSLSFLPFLFGLSVLMTYERVYIKLKNNSNNEETFSYSKKQAVKNFKLQVRQLDRWASTTFLEPLKSKQDVDDSILKFKELLANESNPVEVPPDQGWLPQVAKDFLDEYGLKTQYYDRLYDDEWSASSSYLKVDESLINNIEYRILGDQFVAKSLKLRVNVWDPDTENEILEKFTLLSEVLLERALSKTISTNLDTLIRDKLNVKNVVEGRKVILERKEWKSINNSGYDISFEVRADSVKK